MREKVEVQAKMTHLMSKNTNKDKSKIQKELRLLSTHLISHSRE
jgi:hypothetical protein